MLLLLVLPVIAVTQAPPPPPPSPPPPPPLADELAGVAAPGWVRTEGDVIGWRRDDGVAVTAQPVPWPCRRHVGAPVGEAPIFTRLPDKGDGRIYLCLQREAESTLVRVEAGRLDGGVIALVTAVASALRPPVTLIQLDATIQPRLPLTTQLGGFVVHGLEVQPTVRLRVVPGTCGIAFPPGPTGARWRGATVRWPDDVPGPLELRGGAGGIDTCIERRDDAVVVEIDRPPLVAAPTVPGGHVLDRDLADVLAAIAATARDGVQAPRWYPNVEGELTLPRSGLTLRTRHASGDGWFTETSVRHDVKLVDGAAWDEPVTDVLLPRRPYRYAVAVQRAPCAFGSGAGTLDRPTTSPLVPPLLGAVRVGGAGASWRTRVCIDGRFVVTVLRLGTAGTPSSPEPVRALITDIARAAGVRVPGPERLVQGLGFITAGLLWPENAGAGAGAEPSSAMALRVRGRYQQGRAAGLVATTELAIGLGGGAFQPDDPDGKTDLVGDLRFGLGGAVSRGPWTFDATASAGWDAYWPDGSWLRASAAVGVGDARRRLELRYTASALRIAHAADLTVSGGRFAAFARVVRFSSGAPLGVELGLGLSM